MPKIKEEVKNEKASEAVKETTVKAPYKTTLSAADLNELNAQAQIIQKKFAQLKEDEFVINVLNDRKNQYLSDALVKLGADPKKQFKIDWKTGEVVEVVDKK